MRGKTEFLCEAGESNAWLLQQGGRKGFLRDVFWMELAWMIYSLEKRILTDILMADR